MRPTSVIALGVALANDRGFTLIEVLISLALAALLLAAVAAAVAPAFRYMRRIISVVGVGVNKVR